MNIIEKIDNILNEEVSFTDGWIKKSGAARWVVMGEPNKKKVINALTKAYEEVGLDTDDVKVNKYKKGRIEGFEMLIPVHFFDMLDTNEIRTLYKVIKKELG